MRKLEDTLKNIFNQYMQEADREMNKKPDERLLV